MKKLIYIILFAVASSIAITSCTEEQVTPRQGDHIGGGFEHDPL